MSIRCVLSKIKHLLIYVVAKTILIFHYEQKYFVSGRWFNDGEYGRYSSYGWKWVINDYILCKRYKNNRDVPWPVSPQIKIYNARNISFHPDDLNNFQGIGNYYQAFGKIVIGRGTYIASNVGIITSNHCITDPDFHDEPRDVNIGEKCWIGMNSVILPGITLGAHTIVGAGAIVTKSFPEGFCVIGGNPARVIKKING